MEKKTRASDKPVPPQFPVPSFSIARSDEASPAESKNSTGIVIQIRMKEPAAAPGKLLTRKNTEFWVSANE